MVNPEHFKLPDEQIIARLKTENNWYEKKYGPYVHKRGLNNWKNLFKKPNILEWTILFMLLMGLFMGWAYSRDIGMCREFIEKVESGESCNMITPPQEKSDDFNISSLDDIIIKEENSVEEEVT